MRQHLRNIPEKYEAVIAQAFTNLAIINPDAFSPDNVKTWTMTADESNERYDKFIAEQEV